MPDKPCRVCGALRGTVGFAARQNCCKPCWSEYQQKWREENRPKCRGYSQKYESTNRASRQEKCARWRAENPEKNRECQVRYRQENRIKCREMSRASRLKNPGAAITRMIRYRERNPEKWNARVQARQAVRRGVLVKGPCEACGVTADVQAHHDDYSKPLDVRWLCRICHLKLHGQYIEAA